MREALAPLLFQDEGLPAARRTRDPVALATPSAAAPEKKQRRHTPEGLPLHSLHMLLAMLGTCCRNTCCTQNPGEPARFTRVTKPTALQRRALELLGLEP